MQNSFYNLNLNQVLAKLKTSVTGLTKEEVSKRQAKDGLNKLPEPEKLSALKIFFAQFKSVFVYVLLIASLVALFLGEWVDFVIILAAVLINVLVGFIQENKAQTALFEIQKAVKFESKVLRDGLVQLVPVEELVVGDLIFLEAGDQIPADARLIEVNNFQTVESLLTGEATSVLKDFKVLEKGKIVIAEQQNMVFRGTVVNSGRAKAIVTAIGLKTEVGKIAQTLKITPDEETPLQIKLRKFSYKLGFFVLLSTIIILGIGLLRGQSFWDIFLVAVATAVSAIPEGLLVSITVILAIGMQRILKKKSLIRKLIAAETLGGCSVLCVDKTGTLTEGRMQVREVATVGRNVMLNNKTVGVKYYFTQILELAVLCNNAVVENPELPKDDWKYIGSSTEIALLKAGLEEGLDYKDLQKKYPRQAEIPFDSHSKMMCTLHQDQGEFLNICKGAPEVILKKCQFYLDNGQVKKINSKIIKKLEKKIKSYSQKGYRLLAVSYQNLKNKKDFKENIDNLIFAGLLIIEDPVRDKVKETIKLAQQAGLKIVMITGDHQLTAQSIAQEIGLKVKEENILTGQDLQDLNKEELNKKITDIKVFARVSPMDKLKIVDAWQARGEVVAMTGDGVNDAPALKSADIGLAVGAGSEITKGVADVVILDNNLGTIIEAIRQGRIILKNIKKVIVYLLSDSFSEIILILGALLMGLPLPITAAQILWINLITDGFPAAALTLEKGEDGVMKEKPQPRSKKILDREMKVLIFIIGVFTDLILLSLFWFLTKNNLDINYVRTIIFAVLALDSLLYVFSCRSLTQVIFKTPLNNKWLIWAVIAGFILELVALYTPFFQKIFNFTTLTWEWGLIFSLGFMQILLIEVVKSFFRKKNYN